MYTYVLSQLKKFKCTDKENRVAMLNQTKWILGQRILPKIKVIP